MTKSLKGRTTLKLRKKYTDKERFMQHVVKGKTLDDCWIWHSVRGDKKPYISRPKFAYKKQVYGAGRVALKLFQTFTIYGDGTFVNGKMVDPIKSDLYVLHSCDNIICVNPKHLRLGTASENSEDMIKRSRHSNGNRRCAIGKGNCNVKLTEEQVIEIRKSNDSNVSLAKQYGISREHMWNITSGKSWKHLLDQEIHN